MAITNLNSNAILAHRVTIAMTPASRMTGLLKHSSLPEGDALVITGCQSIHMFFMKFAIDVVFVDGQNRVIGLCANIRPFHLSSIFWKSACAIELPAGTIEKTGTKVGDVLQIK